MSELSLVERAQSGQVDAIAALMNSSLRRLGIQARAAWQDNRLYVLLESTQPPEQRPCIEFIQQGLAQLQRIQAESAVVYGRGLGQTLPSWVQQIDLTSPVAQDSSLQMATIQIPEWLDSPDTELIEIPESPRVPDTAHQPRPTVPAVPAGPSQLVHRPRAVRRRKPAHRWYLAVLHKVLANDRLFVGVLVGLPLFVVLLGGYALNRLGVGTVAKSTASTPASTPAPSKAQAAAPAQPDVFESALQQASVAMELGQAGKTPEDWQRIAQEWQGAIAQMQAVPKTHPNATIAQIKLEEYQETLRQITAEHLSPAP